MKHAVFSASEDWIPAKGEMVKALTVSGAFVTRRVWAIGERVIYLCSDRQYGELQRGIRLKSPIGFPKQDVFKLSDAKSDKQ